jgi:PPOX class probable F420-dependent enzyme
MNEIQTVTSFDHLAGSKFLLVTTFKRSGTAVPSPICHVVENGIALGVTMEETGKVKRIRNDQRVLVGACDMRGNPTGPTYAAKARFVPVPEMSRMKSLRENRFLGAVFARKAHAHWIVKPVQLYERIRFRHRFIALAFEPAAAFDLPAATKGA